MSATTQPAAQQSSYVQRAIDITIILGLGPDGNGVLNRQQFFPQGPGNPNGQSNTAKLTGLRTSVSISKAGTPDWDRIDCRVYGVPPSVMNAISTLGVPMPAFRNNKVIIEAGTVGGAMSIVFAGFITRAWQDYNSAPDTFLNIEAGGALDAAMLPAQATSYPGPVDVATALTDMARRADMAFENNGVQAQLPASYFAGSLYDQMNKIKEAAGIEMYIDTTTARRTLAIWPKTGTRGGRIPLISAESGLIGYPTFQDQGMYFRCLYNPDIRLGGQIRMQSSVGGATAQVTNGAVTGVTGGPNGVWYVVSPLVHDLSAQLPGGPWFTDVTCALTQVPGTS